MNTGDLIIDSLRWCLSYGLKADEVVVWGGGARRKEAPTFLKEQARVSTDLQPHRHIVSCCLPTRGYSVPGAYSATHQTHTYLCAYVLGT